MSRMGNKPIAVTSAVTIDVKGDTVEVKGPKGTLTQAMPQGITLEKADGFVHVKCANAEDSQLNKMHGTIRSLLASMVKGVTEGFKIELELSGVGYRGQVTGSKLTLNLGYSIPMEYAIPAGVSIKMADQTHLTLESIDKQKVGQAAADIRAFRVPDAYHGKGVRFVGEQLSLKEGKKVGN